MKKLILIIISLCITVMTQALTVTSTAGNLSTAITNAGGSLTTVTNLTINGVVDARDFKIIRENTPLLTSIDLSGVNIELYVGNAESPTSPEIITYPANTVPQMAFALKSITSIILPSNITAIGYNAFETCTSLTTITIPLTVTSIGQKAFYQCSSLSGTLVIPPSVSTIYSEAFYGCTGLSTITIPSTVISIGNLSFSCGGNITVSPTNPNYSSVDGILFNKNKTTIVQCPLNKTGEYIIPSTVTKINGDCFYGCSSLTSIIIPPSVTIIESGAFIRCTALTTITIPSSVTSIAGNAFSVCSGLTSIYVNKTTPIDLSASIDFPVFSNVDKSTCILHVPVGTKSLYENAVQWKDFLNIVEDLPNAVNNASANTFKVRAQNGQIVISGVQDGDNIAVYNMQGITIYNQEANGDMVMVNLPARGVYVVRVGNVSKKISAY